MTRFILVKFGQREHLDDVRRGRLYMQSLWHFARDERNRARADRLEGKDHMIQPKDIEYMMFESGGDAVSIGPELITAPFVVGRLETLNQNVFCLFSLSELVRPPRLDPRIREFGGCFVVVLRPQSLFEQIGDAAAKIGMYYEARPVEYFDDGQHTGEIGPFRKSTAFAYQKEFRVVLAPGFGRVYVLDIGSMDGVISDAFPVDDFEALIGNELEGIA